MKALSRILTAMLFCAPVGLVHASPVATTSGPNLTAFNPSYTNNNQWATMSNGRYDGNNSSAKVNFGNCNAVILRCAQPKCGNGGCSDMAVASSIVSGCVKSNDSCKQYGDDLVQYMSAQVVASSNAKINEQNAAIEQAKIQAEAQAAAVANAQSQQQIAAMQQQMQEMQYQMQQQQQTSAQQLQDALTQQQQQSAQALNDMKTAATAAAMQTEAGISSYQQEAINRGISEDILARQKISGQVMTEIENAEVSLKEVKASMNSAFEYAGCDTRGNNCEGPKRVKKWRELAHGFIDPYNNTIDKIYEALTVAQGVGVDLSDIYMMLNDSCNSWGQYMCAQTDKGQIVYSDASSGQKGTPYVCSSESDGAYKNCDRGCYESHNGDIDGYRKCQQNCLSFCRPCTLLKTLVNKEEIYEGWVDAEASTAQGNTTVVACASGALDTSKFFASRSRRRNGAGLIDIDALDVWITQAEPKYKSRNSNVADFMKYCSIAQLSTIDGLAKLEKSTSSKAIASGLNLCVEDYGTNTKPVNEGECPYINPIYAICDAHPYNNNRPNVSLYTADPDNCTPVAKDISSVYENKSEIVYAKWEGTSTNRLCKVKLCRGKYKVNSTDNGCVLCTNDDCSDDANRANAISEWKNSMTEYNEVQEVVRLKTTVLSQQLYKQYEYLNATLRRLKTQLEKAVLTSNLEAAGAKSSSSSGLLGANGSDDKTIHLPGASNCMNFSGYDEAYRCLQNNINLIINNANGSNYKNACKQLQVTMFAAQSILSANSQTNYTGNCTGITASATTRSCPVSDKNAVVQCAQALNIAVMNEKREQERQDRQYSYYPR